MEGTMAALTPNAGRQSARKLYMYTAKNPVFAPAKQYADLGFKLVAWHGGNPVSKFPKRQGWGIKPLDPSTINGEDMIGLNHGLSHTVVIDGDDLPLTRKVFDEIGLDVDAMPGDPPSYCGNPERLKWIYRLPEGFTPPGVKKLSGTVNGKHTTVFELRGCAEGTQAQDVLPPSRHPTGGSYEWINPLVAYDQLPELPADLADLWTRWDTVKDQLCAMAGLDLPPEPEPRAPTTPQPSTIRGDSVIEAFNAANRIENIIERHGYLPKDGKWLAPQSTTGDPGVTIDTIGGKQLLYSHHGTDPLGASNHGGHALDAFAVYQVLEGGSVKAAASELGMGKPPTGKLVANSPQVPTVIVTPLPTPLPDDLPPVEAFDVELLPSGTRGWAWDLANRMDGAPVDFAATNIMVAMAALVGRKVSIQPKEFDHTWTVIPNLWGLNIGAPSVKKTPIARGVFSYMKKLETDARNDHKQEMIEHKALKRADELMAKNAEAAAKKNTELDRDAMAKLLIPKDEEAPVPVCQRYIVNDTTVEKLGEILAESNNGILMLRDELDGWLKSLDREDNTNDRAFYLEGWNGNDAYVYDRIGRGTIVIPHCLISLIGNIQPGKLQPYLNSRASGDGDDGLMERMQLAVFPDISRAKMVDRAPQVSDQKSFIEVMDKLNALPSGDDPMVMRFSAEAQSVFNAWYEQHLIRLSRGHVPDVLVAHLSKYASLVPTIALLLHLAAENAGTDVSITATDKAIRWAKYLESHAARMYSLGTDDYYAARSLLKHLHKLPNSFSASDFRSKQWTGLVKADDREQALGDLVKYGHLKSVDVLTSGRPKVTYTKCAK